MSGVTFSLRTFPSPKRFIMLSAGLIVFRTIVEIEKSYFSVVTDKLTKTDRLNRVGDWLSVLLKR